MGVGGIRGASAGIPFSMRVRSSINAAAEGGRSSRFFCNIRITRLASASGIGTSGRTRRIGLGGVWICAISRSMVVSDLKGTVARQHLVHDDTERIKVRAPVQVVATLSLRLLGRDVQGSADHESPARQVNPLGLFPPSASLTRAMPKSNTLAFSPSSVWTNTMFSGLMSR